MKDGRGEKLMRATPRVGTQHVSVGHGRHKILNIEKATPHIALILTPSDLKPRVSGFPADLDLRGAEQRSGQGIADPALLGHFVTALLARNRFAGHGVVACPGRMQRIYLGVADVGRVRIKPQVLINVAIGVGSAVFTRDL